jgi:hypothetical protein
MLVCIVSCAIWPDDEPDCSIRSTGGDSRQMFHAQEGPSFDMDERHPFPARTNRGVAAGAVDRRRDVVSRLLPGNGLHAAGRCGHGLSAGTLVALTLIVVLQDFASPSHDFMPIEK